MTIPSTTSNSLIAERYRLGPVLGHGGMATVYRAYDEHLARTMALKIVERFPTSGGPEADAFLREARSAAALQHPNVVTTFDVGEHNGQPVIALELVEGGDLAELLLAPRSVAAGRGGAYFAGGCAWRRRPACERARSL